MECVCQGVCSVHRIACCKYIVWAAHLIVYFLILIAFLKDCEKIRYLQYMIISYFKYRIVLIVIFFKNRFSKSIPYASHFSLNFYLFKYLISQSSMCIYISKAYRSGGKVAHFILTASANLGRGGSDDYGNHVIGNHRDHFLEHFREMSH